MSDTKEILKQQLIEVLNIEDLAPADIDDDMAIFGEGLGVDSIDGLELMLLMEREYGIKIANSTEARPIFKSVATMAAYIDDHRTK